MEWQPISVVPPLKLAPMKHEECGDLLVWIDDKYQRGFARGRCYRFAGGEVQFKADGYNGDWNITHWAHVPPPGEQA